MPKVRKWCDGMKHVILIYGRETGMAEKLELLCRGEQFMTKNVLSRKELFGLLQRKIPQVVILDVAVEEQGYGEGMELILEVRRKCDVPVIVVTDQRSENAKIAALSLGADDYLTKEENPLVMMAHIKSQLRRFLVLSKHVNAEMIYSVDDLKVDDAKRKVTVGEREVRLTPIEYKILRLLVKEKGKVFSMEQIYEEIWKMRAVDVDNTIAVHIRHIRQKIEENPRDPKYLKVIWGCGYMVG